ncbi:cell differentiation protein rcd1-like isoform X2 [Apium graveolens]|uniref:cell differentiation protein rcd1-like isoform X2 n=1 Tax=Apium graveolens TaxID=4045 RepID=UPI003D7A0069
MMCFADYFGRALSAVSASQFPWTKLFRESAIGKIADEVLSIYKSLTPKKLAMKDSSKVCDVLVLFECLATHPQTKMQFLNVKIHCYLYPFLKTEETGKPFHYLRLMSLGVIGGLLRAGTHGASRGGVQREKRHDP